MTLSRVYPVVPTPLLSSEQLDTDALKALLDYYAEAACSGVTVLGSGGELPYFSDAEQLSVVRFAHEFIGGRMNLMVGVNAFSATHARQKIASYEGLADTILLLLDGYYKLPFDEYLAAVSEVVSDSPLPVVFYYFPQVTGVRFSVAQLQKIVALDNIVGIKDSSLQPGMAVPLLESSPGLRYFTGLTLLMDELISLPDSGSICPLASIYPVQANSYLRALSESDEAQIKRDRSVLRSVLPLVNSLGTGAHVQALALKCISKVPLPVLNSVRSAHANTKEALRLMGIPMQATVRKPLPALAPEDRERIQRCLDEASRFIG